MSWEKSTSFMNPCSPKPGSGFWPVCVPCHPCLRTNMKSSLWLVGVVTALSLRAAGAELPPAVLPDGVGVNIHFARGHQQDLDLIAAAGFKFVRMDFGWAGIEHEKGQYDWSAYEELTSNLEQRGLRAVYIFDYSNPLYEETVVSKNPL